MAYQILPYTQRKAREMGLKVTPSTRQLKKLDVYKDGKLLASIGDSRYADYPTYIKTKGKEYADQRRALYYQRHAKDKGVSGKLAKALLW